MNPFRSDSAPYAVALLISAIGWMLATLHGGVQDSMIVSYETRYVGTAAKVRLTNLSKSEGIGPAVFRLGCHAQVGCLKLDDGAAQATLSAVAPTDLAADIRNSSATSVSLDVSLPPGGAVDVDLERGSDKTTIDVFLATDRQKPQGIYLISAATPFAWFVHHYYLIMLATGAGLAAVFCAWLVANLLPVMKPPKAEE